MSIKIVTDSTCDLPAEIIRDLDITVIPLYINFGDKGYLDGVEISRRDFYERLPYCNQVIPEFAPGRRMRPRAS